MGVKEKALAAASSIASGDFLRMVTSAGAARKIDYSKLAKAIVEEYNGSTIAGSAQTLKAALDSLNSKTDGVYGMKRFEANTSGRAATLSSGFRGVLFLLDSGATQMGCYIVGVTGSGTVVMKDVSVASNITITTSTNSMVIKSSTGSPQCLMIITNGTLSV